MKLEMVNDKKPETRSLWSMVAATEDGKKILMEARRLACQREFSMLSDSELLTKASGVKVDPRAGVWPR